MLEKIQVSLETIRVVPCLLSMKSALFRRGGCDNPLIKQCPYTLESRIDVGQGINVGPGKFGKNNKRRAWNKMCKLVLKTPKKLENILSPWKKL